LVLKKEVQLFFSGVSSLSYLSKSQLFLSFHIEFTKLQESNKVKIIDH